MFNGESGRCGRDLVGHEKSLCRERSRAGSHEGGLRTDGRRDRVGKRAWSEHASAIPGLPLLFGFILHVAHERGGWVEGM